jgi:hypothetical protein
MKNKRIADIVGLGQKIEELSNNGLVARQIIEQLKDVYQPDEIPSQATIYNYLAKLKKQHSYEKVTLSGDIRVDINTILVELDNLLDVIFDEYNITYKNRKQIYTDVAFFKALLRSFCNEALRSYEKFNLMRLFWKHYLADEIILPALKPYPEAHKSFLDAIDKIINLPEDIDERMEEIVKRYTTS